MKVRSTSGLLVHTMGKIAIAFIYLIFKTRIRNQLLIRINNQAITNILKDFKAETTNDTAHPRLSNRWLPELDTLGLYLSGKKELQEQYK